MVYWWQYFILPQVCGCVAAGHAVTVVLEGEVLAILPLVWALWGHQACVAEASSGPGGVFGGSRSCCGSQ